LFCPTSNVEHLNEAKNFKVGTIMPIPLLTKKPTLYYTLPQHQGQHLLYQWLNTLGVDKVR
jgi:hypothetical protein